MPAKILLPSVGDSTWAFGSHKCKPKTGILTKNPVINSHLIMAALKLILEKKSYDVINLKIKKKARKRKNYCIT